MKEQTVTITGLRAKTRQIVEQVRSRGGSVIVEILGEPAAAIVGVDEYRELQELKRDRAARQRRFRLMRQAARRNALTEDEAISLIQEAKNTSSQ